MNINISLDESDIKRLVCEEIQRKLGDVPLDTTRVRIETKSKHNYKSEWEVAAFRVEYTSPI